MYNSVTSCCYVRSFMLERRGSVFTISVASTASRSDRTPEASEGTSSSMADFAAKK